jgi:hypothetical protein
MSGFRGTIGSPKEDKVIAFIYDRIEPLEKQTRNRILFAVQSMQLDRTNINTINDLKFRKQVTSSLKKESLLRLAKLIDLLTKQLPVERSRDIAAIASRLNNLNKRYYRST